MQTQKPANVNSERTLGSEPPGRPIPEAVVLVATQSRRFPHLHFLRSRTKHIPKSSIAKPGLVHDDVASTAGEQIEEVIAVEIRAGVVVVDGGGHVRVVHDVLDGQVEECQEDCDDLVVRPVEGVLNGVGCESERARCEDLAMSIGDHCCCP